MCIHNPCFEKNKKNIRIFHLKINIFTAMKYCCILHGRVIVKLACICHQIPSLSGHRIIRFFYPSALTYRLEYSLENVSFRCILLYIRYVLHLHVFVLYACTDLYL